ncbi:PhzF family phenazine biosynthesis protein [Flavihumibacter profundi]|uniref:PhzF family phenazine biosynthesis protein n=1 Tax=Flavihumibacter profundi TaxID=2716883 RepID=UPI001CC5B0A2|nr:PhzF family phenazine biosynthesis protein [Flavihumibacter profundi]MBZ5857013.1 PhzF family phenazine biosynthesis protein [Flavihumibacter profundi]
MVQSIFFIDAFTENIFGGNPAAVLSLATIPARGVICTAKGDATDFVSRCFYPHTGINEDPVTGSAYTIMVPF